MRGVVVVATKAHLLDIGQQGWVIDRAHRFGVVVAARDHLLRPAQEDLADRAFVLGSQRRVDPIDHQRESLAVIANAVTIFGRKVGVAEGRVLGRFVTGIILGRGRSLGRLVHDVHEQGAGAFGIVGADRRVIFHQRQKGKEFSVHLRRILLIAHIATILVGDAPFVHFAFGPFGQ